MSAIRTPAPIQERLDRRTHPGPNGCLVWTGQVRGSYGGISNGRGISLQAHRVAYELAKGPIPDGMVIDHLCRNRLCVNPDHLEAVTPAVNARRRPDTRLTYADVEAIRSSDDPQSVIARRYGVDQSMISLIRSGKRWAV